MEGIQQVNYEEKKNNTAVHKFFFFKSIITCYKESIEGGKDIVKEEFSNIVLVVVVFRHNFMFGFMFFGSFKQTIIILEYKRNGRQ